MSRTGKPTIIGSNSNWWMWDNSTCRYNSTLLVHTCDWGPRTTVGYIQLYLPALMNGCDNAKFGAGVALPNCTDQNAPNTVGRVSHWGPQSFRGLNISPWPGISGMTNTGWSVLRVAGRDSVWLI
jgi:hypothetical protein